MTVIAPPIGVKPSKLSYTNNYENYYYKREDIESYSHLKAILETNTGFIFDNPKLSQGQLGFASSLKPHQTPRTQVFFSEMSNVVALDIEPHKALKNYVDKILHTLEDVVNFLDTYIKLTSYIISKSSSAIEENKVGRWHVWFVFDKNFHLKQFKEFLETVLPTDAWYTLKTENGIEIKCNSYCDLAVYQKGRIFVEHENAEYYMIDRGLCSYISMQKTVQHNSLKRSQRVYVNPQTKEELKEIETKRALNPQTVDLKMLKSGYIALDTELYLKDGTPVLVRDVVRDNKQIRLTALHNMSVGEFNGDMTYNPKTKTFTDWTAGSGGTYKVSETKERLIEYTTKYAPKFDISARDTFILAPTGSGKSTQLLETLRATPTLFIVPKVSIVKDLGGLLAGKAHWSNVNKFGINVMTYDKLYGHLMTEKIDISEFTIVIDEIHTLFSDAHNKVYKAIYEWFLLRKKKFNNLILLTATLDAHVLPIEDLVSYKYINMSKKTHVEFYKNVGDISTLMQGRTLIFLQSRLRIGTVYDRFNSTMRVLALKSGSEIPENFEDYDLIVTTSVLREGFSIKTHIDTVLIYNVLQPAGAYDLLQSFARPRENQPTIKIIAAQSHFKEENTQAISLAKLLKEAERLSKGYSVEDVELLKAINIDHFKSCVLDTDGEDTIVNQVGVTHFYLHLAKQRENRDFEAMKKTMQSFLNCEVTCTILNNESNLLPQIEKYVKDLKKRKLEISTFKEKDDFIADLEALAEASMQIQELLASCDISPIKTLDTKEGLMYLTEQEQTQYVMNPAVYSKLNQHKRNINERVYDTLMTNRAWKEQEVFSMGGLKKIFKVLDKEKRLLSDDEVIEILKKVCVYDKIDKKGNTVKRGDFDKIRVNQKRLYNLSKVPDSTKNMKVKGI